MFPLFLIAVIRIVFYQGIWIVNNLKICENNCIPFLLSSSEPERYATFVQVLVKRRRKIWEIDYLEMARKCEKLIKENPWAAYINTTMPLGSPSLLPASVIVVVGDCFNSIWYLISKEIHPMRMYGVFYSVASSRIYFLKWIFLGKTYWHASDETFWSSCGMSFAIILKIILNAFGAKDGQLTVRT